MGRGTRTVVMKMASIFVCMFVVPLLVLGAERVNLVPSSEDVTVTVLESNNQYTILHFDIAGFSREAVTIDGDEFFALQCGKEGVLLNAGEPALPRICRSLVIPDDAEMEIRILDSEYRDFPSTPVMPSKGSLLRSVNPADVPYTFGSVYRANQWYPAELAELREPYILRDLRGTVVELNAFRYHTGQKVLRVYTSVTVEVRAIGPGRTNVLHRSEPLTHMNPDFHLLYQRRFVNYGFSPICYTPIMETGEMLIITFYAFNPSMRPFVNWKIQKGIPATMVNAAVIGDSSDAIKDYIRAVSYTHLTLPTN